MSTPRSGCGACELGRGRHRRWCPANPEPTAVRLCFAVAAHVAAGEPVPVATRVVTGASWGASWELPACDRHGAGVR